MTFKVRAGSTGSSLRSATKNRCARNPQAPAARFLSPLSLLEAFVGKPSMKRTVLALHVGLELGPNAIDRRRNLFCVDRVLADEDERVLEGVVEAVVDDDVRSILGIRVKPHQELFGHEVHARVVGDLPQDRLELARRCLSVQSATEGVEQPKLHVVLALYGVNGVARRALVHSRSIHRQRVHEPACPSGREARDRLRGYGHGSKSLMSRA